MARATNQLYIQTDLYDNQNPMFALPKNLADSLYGLFISAE